MSRQRTETLEKLRRAIEAIKNGKKPKKRGSVHMNIYGENFNQYQFNGKLFNTADELSAELANWENLENKPDIIMVDGED